MYRNALSFFIPFGLVSILSSLYYKSELLNNPGTYSKINEIIVLCLCPFALHKVLLDVWSFCVPITIPLGRVNKTEGMKKGNMR